MPTVTEKPKTELKEYAGGWMTERKGTDAPAFLKFVLPLFALAAVGYIFIFMNGEVTHSTRGKLVQQLNMTTGSADVFMYMVAGFIAVFLIILTGYLFSKPHED
jgi:hypothetical protein